MHCLESIRSPLKELHILKITRMRDNVDISRLFPLRRLGKSPDDFEERLTEYLEKSLTFESDVLDAFKCVLAAFKQMFPFKVQRLCGILILITSIFGSKQDSLVFLCYGRQIIPEKRPKS